MINKPISLSINEFTIEVDDWCIQRQFFWLKKDYSTWNMNIEDIKDLEEILNRFKEKLKEDSNK